MTISFPVQRNAIFPSHTVSRWGHMTSSSLQNMIRCKPILGVATKTYSRFLNAFSMFISWLNSENLAERPFLREDGS